jgi:uncharacterized NAD(P)/FAD-binding protein YdhS
MRNSIIIVGGGFSGTVLAANLLRRPPAAATEIVLIERAAAFGRGVAYAARPFPFLLNVPAGRLSAESADPMQFLRFAQRRCPAADAEDFLPRSLYGEYLHDLLIDAERNAPARIRLERVNDEVLDVVRAGDEFSVLCAERGEMRAATVVLALGNPRPPVPAWAEGLRAHRAFREDPWDLPTDLGAGHEVLIVGNGLTMADVASALAHDAARAPSLHAISRRGLTPLPQATFQPRAVDDGGERLLSCAASLHRLLRASRMLAREVETLGGDWREVVTLIRNIAPRLWQKLPEAEQRRFVRHLQAHWDVHRHRLPPQLAQRVAELRSGGKLQVMAGRVQSAVAEGERVRICWQPRGSSTSQTMTVDLIVNAIGPDYALHRSAEPLLRSLRTRNLVAADPLDLGLRTARFGACTDTKGRSSGALFYLGPMLRATHWEATAAAELRNHAEQLAAHLVAR